MNIPQMKMQELMDQSDEKKWQLVWGQVTNATYNNNNQTNNNGHVTLTPPPYSSLRR